MKGSDNYIIAQLLDLASQVGGQLAFVASVDHGEKGKKAHNALRKINIGLGIVREKIVADADFIEITPMVHVLGNQLLASVNDNKELRDQVTSYHAFLKTHAPLPDRLEPSNGAAAAITESMRRMSNEISRREATGRSLECRLEENGKAESERKLTREYYECVIGLCDKVVDAIADEHGKAKKKRLLTSDEYLVKEFSDAVLELPSEYDPNFRVAYLDYVVALINALVPEGHALKKETEKALNKTPSIRVQKPPVTGNKGHTKPKSKRALKNHTPEPR